MGCGSPPAEVKILDKEDKSVKINESKYHDEG